MDKRVLTISAKDETGIRELKDCLEEMFISGIIEYNDGIVITNMRHLDLIDQAVNSLDEALNNMDLLSNDIRNYKAYVYA